MKLIVGLGNPGRQYEETRHNVGFVVLDYLADTFDANAPQIKHKAEIRSASIDGKKVLLVKPLTFMNLSGQSVKPLADFYNLAPEDIIVIHDDLDLNTAELRVKQGGGSGGHKGINSIDQIMGPEKTGYHRIRIGIGHPLRKPPEDWPPERVGKQDVADFVLERFSDEEWEKITGILGEIVDRIKKLV